MSLTALLGSCLRTPRKIGGPLLLLLMQACSSSNGNGEEPGGAPDEELAYERVRMVEVQLAGRGIRDERVPRRCEESLDIGSRPSLAKILLCGPPNRVLDPAAGIITNILLI